VLSAIFKGVPNTGFHTMRNPVTYSYINYNCSGMTMHFFQVQIKTEATVAFARRPRTMNFTDFAKHNLPSIPLPSNKVYQRPQ